ncbi:hypothetical protein EOL72_03290 [Candidatus Falkowbacteria bacterium]|nr:hypothetical protein [Candidatus Falkowbacteria bacterium]
MINIFKAYKKSKINIFNIYQAYELLRDNYLKKVEHWHEQLNKVEILEKENKALRESISILEQRLGDPAEVVKKMLGRPLKWKDISKMTDAEKREYGLGAKQALENETLMSEINRLIVDLVNDIARETLNFRQVLNRRFTLNGIQLIKERLESVPQLKEEEPDTEEELNEAI